MGSIISPNTNATKIIQNDERFLLQAHLLDEIYDAVIATDLEISITYWNKAAERTYGWTAQQALGKKCG